MDVVTFCQNDLQSVSFAALEDMRRKGLFCDLTLNIGNHSFTAHRNIVAAAIPYFRSVFMSEGTEVKRKEFEVEDLDPKALQSLIDFAYSSKVNISSENVRSLLVTSQFLQLDQVQGACVQFITDRLNVNNVMEIHKFACNINNSNLIENSNVWIRRNFVEFSKCASFFSLPHSFIKSVISEDDLNVPNEEVVFDAVIKWVQNSPTERHCVLPDLLKEVRMIYLSKEYLIDNVDSQELIRNSGICTDLINEIKNYHMLPSRKSLLSCSYRQPRNHWMHIYAVGSCTNCGLSLHNFDLGNETWYPFASRKEERGIIHNIIGVNEKVYMFLDESILTFCLKSHEWEVLQVKRQEIKGAAVVLHENTIFFFGSADANFQKEVRHFDSEQHDWFNDEEETELSWAYCAAASDGECIYVTGTLYDNRSFDTVMKYVPSTHEKSLIARMLTPRGKHCCTSTNGKIYVCGGQTTGPVTLNTGEVYDPSTNQWNYISSMKNSLHSFSLVRHCNKLYAFGKNSGEVYDPEIDEWKFRSSVPVGFIAALTAATSSGIRN